MCRGRRGLVVISLETDLWIFVLVFTPLTGAALGWLSIVQPQLRAERNVQRLLEDEPGREELAELILRNPSSENIRRAREMVLGVLPHMSPGDRRLISSTLNQASIRGRAWLRRRSRRACLSAAVTSLPSAVC